MRTGFFLLFLSFFAVNSCNHVSASELSLQGSGPIAKEKESGIGINSVSNNYSLELYYRKCNLEKFDWGFSLAPLPINSAFPGNPDFLFDLKVRIIKGSNIIPTFSLGVNMLRIRNLDPHNFNPTVVFLDEGRLGLSWEFIQGGADGGGEVKKNIIYTGVNVLPGGSQVGNHYFAGAKFDNMNLTFVLINELHSVGLSYSF